MPIWIFTSAQWFRAALAGACLVALCGCQPSGPKSLLLGAEQIREGDYPRALKHLNRAAEIMPAHPQVWNHLGLAWHGSKQPQKAAEAYGRALKIDPKLPAAHFNLGMLFLEQGRLNEAIAALSSFVSLQPTNAVGVSKLGAALVQAGRIDEGERALNQALRLNPKDAEAHNNLGLIHVHRKRARDAMLEFNEALEDRPNYPSALLNQAVVAQVFFGRRDMAIERYRAYVHSNKDGRLETEVNDLIRQLEEANRAAARPPVVAQTNEVAAPPATNAVAAASPTSAPPSVAATNVAALRPPPKTNVVAPPATNLVAQKTSAPPARVEATNSILVAKAPTPAPKPESPPKEAATEKEEDLEEDPPVPIQVEVVSEPDFEIKPPRDVVSPAPKEVQMAAARPATNQPPLYIPRRDREEPDDRQSFLERANPMRWFRSDDRDPPPVAPPSVRAEPPPRFDSPNLPRIAPQFERYPYQKNPPVRGNRAEAEKLFVQGARAHQEQRLGAALDFYRQAVQADPSFFNPQYNLGLAAYQLKQLSLALQANENARLIDPKSVDARYHFAISLREANYPVDAANELRDLVAIAPDETRAHLALANLYAQKLDEADLAERHYQRLLELAPNHPEAPAIRQWLSARP